MNSVQAIGRLTRDPDLSEVGEKTLCRFGLAVPRRDRESDPVFIEVCTFGGLAQTVAKYLERGRRVAIDGRLDSYTKETEDGSKRTSISVIARNVEFLDAPRREGGDELAAPRDPEATATGESAEVDPLAAFAAA